MKLRITSFVLLVTLAFAFLAIPGSAAAKTQTATAAPRSPIASIALNHVASGATLNITGFIVSKDGKSLLAVGNVTTKSGGVLATFTTPASISPALPATCDIVTLTIDPIHIDILGLVIDIPDPIIVNITGETGRGKLLGNLLCYLVGILNPGPVAEQAVTLNKILGVLNTVGINPLTNIPVRGLRVSGGALTITKFSVASDGKTIIANGVVKNSAGKVVTTFSTPVALAPGDTCEILTLTLNPIHIDILGLVIDIPGPVVIHITGQTGPGLLLGNLLCAIVGLLNPGGSPTAIVKDLNAVLLLTH